LKWRTAARLPAIYEYDGPVAVRYPRGGEGAYTDFSGRGDVVCLRHGDDVTLVSYGILINEVLAAADLLQQSGVFATVLKINRIVPLENEMIRDSVRRTGKLLVAEDCVANGCVGQRIAADLAQNGVAARRIILQNLGEDFVQQGSIPELYHAFGLDAQGIAEAVLEGSHEQ
jgi:1-deoxy-D-xylulose-5-phosphate synthase